MESWYARARDGWWIPLLALVVAAAAVAVAGRGGSGGGQTVAPARLLVASIGGRIELLDGRTGRVVRTLSSSVGADVVAPSPDGRFVYFDRPEDRPGCAQAGFVVERLEIGSGAVTRVRRGSWPRLSPDGRYLAFSDVGVDPCADPTRVGLIDLTRRVTRFVGLSASIVSARPVSWAPDSAHLLIVVEGNRPRFLRARIGSGRRSSAVQPVPLVDDADPASFYGHSDRYVVGEQGGDVTTVVAMSWRGRDRQRLFSVAATIGRLALDRSGRRLLLQAGARSSPAGGSDLWVWRRGASSAELVFASSDAATSVLDAAWAPPTLTARGSPR